MKPNKKAGLSAGLLTAGIIFVVLVCGCTETKDEPGKAGNISNNLTVPANTSQGAADNAPVLIFEPKNITIKVVKFEPDNPCQGCTNLGNYAEETIKTHFPGEYKSGKITYETVNYQDPKNRQIIEKYNVMGSSLYITVIKDGKEEIIDANDMWNYVWEKEEYLKIFKDKLDEIKKL